MRGCCRGSLSRAAWAGARMMAVAGAAVAILGGAGVEPQTGGPAGPTGPATAAGASAPAAVPNPSLAPPAISSFGGQKAVTRPSRDATLTFTIPTEIAEIVVRGGEAVKVGQPLVRGEDTEVRAQVELQQLLADTELDVKRAEAQLELAQIEYQGAKDAHQSSGLSKVELDRAENALKTKLIELDVAKLQRQQQALELKRRKAGLDRFTIKAPFDGRVDEVLAEVGEIKRETDKILRVVRTDPLWIDVPAPTGETITLGIKPGDRAWIILDVPGEQRVQVGKIIEVAAAADAGGNTRRVRVELANRSDWPSGTMSWVRFSEPPEEWKARVLAPADDAPRAAWVHAFLPKLVGQASRLLLPVLSRSSLPDQLR